MRGKRDASETFAKTVGKRRPPMGEIRVRRERDLQLTSDEFRYIYLSSKWRRKDQNTDREEIQENGVAGKPKEEGGNAQLSKIRITAAL